jgi:hypothetical protein
MLKWQFKVYGLSGNAGIRLFLNSFFRSGFSELAFKNNLLILNHLQPFFPKRHR